MTSRRLKFTDAALDDLVEIREYTEAVFGSRQADRYDALLRGALADIRENPNRPGSRAFPSLGERFREYRIELCARRSGSGVKGARHVVIYVELSEVAVGVSRILHDSMLMERHIPESHRYGDEAYLSDEGE